MASQADILAKIKRLKGEVASPVAAGDSLGEITPLKVRQASQLVPAGFEWSTSVPGGPIHGTLAWLKLRAKHKGKR